MLRDKTVLRKLWLNITAIDSDILEVIFLMRYYNYKNYKWRETIEVILSLL